MKKLLSLLSIFAIVLSCSSDETSTQLITKYKVEISASIGGSVSTTGGDFQSGYVLTFSAIPSENFFFTSWSDGYSEATRSILIESNVSLTANFEKKKYPLTVNIEGNGEIIEEIINAGRTTDYDTGTTVKLTAVPAEGWEFIGWTGAINSDELEIQLSVNESKEVNAFFTQNCLDNLLNSMSPINRTSSHYKPYFIPFLNYFQLAFDYAVEYSCKSMVGKTFLNINNNDIPDLMFVKSNGCNENLGTIYVFVDNLLKYEFTAPQAMTNKLLRGDINEDGIDDVVLIGTGLDAEPWPGDQNYIMYFYEDSYELIKLDEEFGYFHTGALGDVNNDGHLDILPINPQLKDSYIHFGDGQGNFLKQKVFDKLYTTNTFQSELYDFNGDGKLDIIMGGHEYVLWDWQTSGNKILLGDGLGNFDINNPIKLPEIDGWGVITNFRIFDLDQDGIGEIIITRTSGSKESNGNLSSGDYYSGFKIQILKNQNGNYIESMLLDSPDGFDDLWVQWIQSTNVIDINGDCILDLVPESDYINDFNFEKIKMYNRLYYEGNSDGSYSIKYDK